MAVSRSLFYAVDCIGEKMRQSIFEMVNVSSTKLFRFINNKKSITKALIGVLLAEFVVIVAEFSSSIYTHIKINKVEKLRDWMSHSFSGVHSDFLEIYHAHRTTLSTDDFAKMAELSKFKPIESNRNKTKRNESNRIDSMKRDGKKEVVSHQNT